MIYDVSMRKTLCGNAGVILLPVAPRDKHSPSCSCFLRHPRLKPFSPTVTATPCSYFLATYFHTQGPTPSPSTFPTTYRAENRFPPKLLYSSCRAHTSTRQSICGIATEYCCRSHQEKTLAFLLFPRDPPIQTLVLQSNDCLVLDSTPGALHAAVFSSAAFN